MDCSMIAFIAAETSRELGAAIVRFLELVVAVMVFGLVLLKKSLCIQPVLFALKTSRQFPLERPVAFKAVPRANFPFTVELMLG